jgi:hypothetical protein
MRKRMIFVTPYSAVDEGATEASDMSALDNLLAGMDGGAADDAGASSDGEGTAAPDDAGAEGSSDGSSDNNPDGNAGVPSEQDRRTFAFGKMRKELSNMTELLGKVATANGIEYRDTKELVAKLNDEALQKMAQKQSVPVELLREIEQLRQDSAAYKQQRLKDEASLGFQQVMDTYKLSNEQLKAFALELDDAGKNPFEQPVDLLAEYRLRHFDDIIEAAKKAAVEEALRKDSAATQSSTTPAKATGSSAGAPQKVTTVQGLNALLAGVNL